MVSVAAHAESSASQENFFIEIITLAILQRIPLRSLLYAFYF